MKRVRILLALMGLEIGGAETHAVELAKYLCKKGYIVYAVSSGGVYEKELTECGVRHYYAPLTKKDPLSMLKSYRVIKKVVLREKIDLIHAHARIPAFVSSLVKKRLGIPLVSTVHGVYSTAPWFKLLTNWGDEAICVSEDIQKYVIENYNFSSENTSVTINGIDTDLFSGDFIHYDALAEFNLPEHSFKIVCVSRLDSGNTNAAYALLNIADKLSEKIENLKIIIVGGGNEFDKINALCVQKNNELEKEIFVMTNSRTDVNKFLSIANVFVGISRAALEAMSARVPVILSGQFGYGGIFSPDNAQKCIKNNFTCRGEEFASDNTFFDDIMTVYNMSPAEREALVSFGRETVVKNYSITAMAENTITAYNKVLSEKANGYDFMISGYFGFNNSGDDALLQAMIDDLKELDESLRIVVLSRCPEETVKRYGVYAINRFSIFKILKYMNRTKVLLSGGGSLIQDVTSTKSVFYYLTVMKTALKKHMSLMVYANGVGPINKQKNRKFAKKIFDKADIITLREEGSLKLLKEIGVKNENIILTADPALNLKASDSTLTENVLKSHGIKGDINLIGVSVRPWKKNEHNFEKNFAKNLDIICRMNNVYPVFLPMQLPRDLEFSKKICAYLETPYYIVGTRYDEKIFAGIISRCSLLIGMRLHSLIYAASVCVPIVGIVYDPKVKSFLDYVGQTHFIDAEKISSEGFISVISDCLKNKDAIKEDFSNRIELLCKKAKSNASIAMKLLNKETIITVEEDISDKTNENSQGAQIENTGD